MHLIQFECKAEGTPLRVPTAEEVEAAKHTQLRWPALTISLADVPTFVDVVVYDTETGKRTFVGTGTRVVPPEMLAEE